MQSNLHEARLADIDALPRVVGATTRREPKLDATARSFAILEHVARSGTPIEVLDINGLLKLPKATAYRLVEWFITQGYLSREPGRKRLIIGPKLTTLAFGALSSSMRNDATAYRAAAAGTHGQRILQYRHAAQRRGDISGPCGGRVLAAAPAIHQWLTRAAALPPQVNWRKYSVKNSGTDNKAAKDLSKRSKRVIP